VIPSLPGFGFSGKWTATGWGPERIARAWVALMQRLGYAQFVAQGGDVGAGVCTAMAKQAPQQLLGIHTNFPGILPPDVRTRSRRAIRHRQLCRQTSNAASISSSFCSRSGATTPTSWRRVRKRYTDLRIRPSASPPG
jgi:pimeloyl-ACP methyl ester carboxylesterase